MASSPPIRGSANPNMYAAFGEGDLENAVPPGCTVTVAKKGPRPAVKKPLAGAQAAASAPSSASPVQKKPTTMSSPPVKGSAASSSSPAIKGSTAFQSSSPAIKGSAAFQSSSPAIKGSAAFQSSSPAIKGSAAFQSSSPAIKGSAAADGAAGSSPAAPARTGADFYERMLESGADPFGGAATSSAASSKPLASRVSDKNWKVRKEAYEEILALISAGDSSATEWTGSIPAMVKDSNAAAQEKGAEVCAAMLEKFPKDGAGPALEVAGILVDKGLNGRPSFKNAATEIFHQLVENEHAEAAVEALVAGTGHKVPKTAAAAARLLFEIFKAFGAKVVSPKPLLKALPGMFDHADTGVRGAAQDLALEIYRWIRAAIKQSLKDLKPVQLKELDDLFAKEDEKGTLKPTPTRLTRAEQARRDANPAAYAAEMEQKAGKAVDDDILGPTEVLSKLKPAWFSQLESAKWQDRKEALGTLIGLCENATKIAPGDFGDVMRAMRKIVKDDANVNVVTVAIQAMGLLARGLGSSLNTYTRGMVPILLDKFKDKNRTVLTACHATLGFMFKSLNFAELIDDISSAAVHKVPKVKSEAFTLLQTVFSDGTVEGKDVKKSLKDITAILVSKGIADGVVEVRDAATKATTALAALVGPQAITPLLADVEPSRLATIVGASGATSGSASASSSAAAPVSARASSAPSSAAAATSSSAAAGSKTARPSTAVGAKPGASKAAPSSSGAAAGKDSKGAASRDAEGGKGGESSNEDISPSMSSDAAAERLEAAVGDAAIKGLKSANWKERLECFDAFFAHFSSPAACEELSEALILGIEKITQGKEGNFQVNRRMLELYVHVINTSSVVPRRVVASLVPVLIGKIHDAKTRDNSRAGLTACAEVSHPSFVAGLIAKESQTQKNPKVVMELLSWLKECIGEFGTASLVSQVKVLIDFVRNSLDNSNAAIRTEALGVITALGANAKLAAAIKSKLADMKPATVGNVEDALAKSPSAEGAPARVARGDAPARRGGAAGASASAPGAGEAGDIMDELNPRVDISAKLTPELLEKLGETGKDNWRTKQEALEAITKILNDANNRILPKIGDLQQPLKKLLSDVNKNIVAQAAGLVGQLGTALGPACDKFSKVFFGTLLSCFCDNKSNVRTAVTGALDAWVVQLSVLPVFHHAAAILSGPNPNARLETLVWMSSHDAEIRALDKAAAGKDLLELVKPLVACLQDKTPDIRSNADAVLAAIASVVGSAGLNKEAKNMTPTERAVVEAFNKKHPDTVASAAPVAPAHARPSTASAAVAPSTAASSAATPGTPATKARPKTAGTPNGTPAKRAAGAGAAAPAAAPAAAAAAAAVAAPSASAPSAASSAAAGTALKHNDSKEKRRARNDKGVKWILFEELEAKYTDLCREQASQCVSDDLVSALFSDDFKNHLAAVETLLAEIPRDQAFAVESCDVLFKWVSLRLCEGNIRVLLKALELVRVVFEALIVKAYVLNDYEASCLLPFLVDRVGHNNDGLRRSMREIIKDMRKIYPVSKMFAALYEGLRSKNSRSRVECLEEMGSLMAHQGIAVTGAPAKVLPVIAAYVNDRDVHVRTASLAALSEAYNAAASPADFYKYFTTVDEKTKEKLEEKFPKTGPVGGKKAAAVVPKPAPAPAAATAATTTTTTTAASAVVPSAQPVSTAAAAAAAPSSSEADAAAILAKVRQEYGLQMDVLESQVNKASEAPVVAALPASRLAVPSHSILADPTPMPQARALSRLAAPSAGTSSLPVPSSTSASAYSSTAAAAAPASSLPVAPRSNWRSMLRMALSDIPNDSVHIKEFATFLAALGPEGAAEADSMATQLTQLVVDAFSQKREILLNYALHALSLLFSHPHGLGLRATQPTLVCLIRGLAAPMVSPLLASLPDADGVLRSLNSAMLVVLDRADRNVAFSAALASLRQELSAVSKGAANAKVVEVILRVLLKMIKALPKTIDSMNLDHLLLDVHLFFKEHPPHRNRDTPALRTIKTLLTEIVTLRGAAIRNHLSLIPSEEVTPPVVAYIEIMLTPGGADAEVAGTPSSRRSPQQPPQQPNPARANLGFATVGVAPQPAAAVPSGPAPDAALEARLDEIFARLRSVTTSKDAVAELHSVLKDHPEVDISPRMKSMTPGFQSYIMHGLEALKLQASLVAPVAPRTSVVSASNTAAAPLNHGAPAASSAAPVDRFSDIRSKMEAVRQRSAALGSGSRSGIPVPASAAAAHAPVAPVPQVQQTYTQSQPSQPVQQQQYLHQQQQQQHQHQQQQQQQQQQQPHGYFGSHAASPARVFLPDPSKVLGAPPSSPLTSTPVRHNLQPGYHFGSPSVAASPARLMPSPMGPGRFPNPPQYHAQAGPAQQQQPHQAPVFGNSMVGNSMVGNSMVGNSMVGNSMGSPLFSRPGGIDSIKQRLANVRTNL